MGVSTTFQAFFDRDLSTAFEPGEWAGLVPVIVGPHPRAMDYDLRQLRDRPSIVVGAAWLLFAKYSKIPDILYSSYEKFINRSRDNEEFQTWTNYKVCPSFLARSVPNDWLTVEGSKEFFSEDGGLKEGVSTMHDCFTAVCIGAALGAREFDLVGFQLDGNSIGLGFSPQAQKDDHLAILGLNTLAQKYGLKFNNLR